MDLCFIKIHGFGTKNHPVYYVSKPTKKGLAWLKQRGKAEGSPGWYMRDPIEKCILLSRKNVIDAAHSATKSGLTVDVPLWLYRRIIKKTTPKERKRLAVLLFTTS